MNRRPVIRYALILAVNAVICGALWLSQLSQALRWPVWPVFTLIMGTLAIIGAVLAAIWWFIASQREDIAETDAERAYRWRERMREISHNRN